MKKVLGLFATSTAILLFLLFLFMIFVAFNPNSASFIISSAGGGGFFYEKSIRTFSGLLIILFYQSCSSFAILLLWRRMQAANCYTFLKVSAGVGLMLCVSVFVYSAIIPWSIPTTN